MLVNELQRLTGLEEGGVYFAGLVAGQSDDGTGFEAVALDEWTCVSGFECAFVFYLHKWCFMCIKSVIYHE